MYGIIQVLYKLFNGADEPVCQERDTHALHDAVLPGHSFAQLPHQVNFEI